MRERSRLRTRTAWTALVLALFLVPGLANAQELEKDEQKSEPAATEKAPARASEIPAGVRIEVEIDGAALLRRVEPDFRTGARRSSKIERLVGP